MAGHPLILLSGMVEKRAGIPRLVMKLSLWYCYGYG
jgi:hypothetical protein